MAISYLSSSQDLRPLIIIQNKVDTLYGFTIPQSKYIAKKIIKGMYCDSTVYSLNRKISSLGVLNNICDEKIILLQQKEDNYKLIIGNKDEEIILLNKDKENAEKKLKRQRKIGVSIIILLATCLIIK